MGVKLTPGRGRNRLFIRCQQLGKAYITDTIYRLSALFLQTGLYPLCLPLSLSVALHCPPSPLSQPVPHGVSLEPKNVKWDRDGNEAEGQAHVEVVGWCGKAATNDAQGHTDGDHRWHRVERHAEGAVHVGLLVSQHQHRGGAHRVEEPSTSQLQQLLKSYLGVKQPALRDGCSNEGASSPARETSKVRMPSDEGAGRGSYVGADN